MINIGDILIDKVLQIVGAFAVYKDEIATHKTILIDTSKGNFKNLDWYEYYVFMTEDDYNQWQDFCYDYIKKNNPTWNTREIVEEFKIYDLFFGLKCEYIKEDPLN